MKIFNLESNLDRIGVTASTLCAIHCATVPLLLTLLPLYGMEFLANEAFEICMILLSLFLGVWSLGRSYIKAHRKPLPIILLIIGFSLIAMGHFSGISAIEPILIPVGGLVIAAAHMVNIRLFKNCHHKAAAQAGRDC